MRTGVHSADHAKIAHELCSNDGRSVTRLRQKQQLRRGMMCPGPPVRSDQRPGTKPGPGTKAHGPGTHQGRIVTFLMIGGVVGWLDSPPGPAVVGVSAMLSTTSWPDVTFAKMT
jgi:hypothetical protein